MQSLSIESKCFSDVCTCCNRIIISVFIYSVTFVYVLDLSVCVCVCNFYDKMQCPMEFNSAFTNCENPLCAVRAFECLNLNEIQLAYFPHKSSFS